MKFEINSIMQAFRDFLDLNWSGVSNALSQAVLDDWIQANWELLVESRVCKAPYEFLEVYGDGADCNDGSSRVWYPEATPTHEIKCVLKSDSKDALSGKQFGANTIFEFEAFSSWDTKRKQYSTDSPFDYALCLSGEELAIFPLGNVDFVIHGAKR